MDRDLRQMRDHLLVQHLIRQELHGADGPWAPYRRALVVAELVFYDLGQSLKGNPGLCRLFFLLCRSGYGIVGALIRVLVWLLRRVARVKEGYKYQRLLLR